MAENKSFAYRPQGVCSRMIEFELDDEGRVHDVSFAGGCDGNTNGIGALVEGMPADWVVDRVKGTQCGNKGTSCPDQLAHALEAALAEGK